MKNAFEVKFVPTGRGKAQCAPNPEYPKGIALDCSGEEHNSCVFALPYPAPECGMFVVTCNLCKMTAAITAAGRVDDPISVKLACLPVVGGKA